MDLARARNRHGQIWLNVASSHYVLPDYENLDNGLYFRLAPFLPVLRPALPRKYLRDVETYRAASKRAQVVLHDCRRPLPFPDGSVDHVLCSHFLEHVYPDEARQILRDFHRVLRPGGTIHVILPSLEHIVRAYVDGTTSSDALVESTILTSPRRPSLKFRVLEFLGFEGLKHRWMYDLDAITKRVVAAGFELVDHATVPSKGVRAEDGAESIHVAGRKPAPQS